jgi:hypothetical protein
MADFRQADLPEDLFRAALSQSEMKEFRAALKTLSIPSPSTIRCEIGDADMTICWHLSVRVSLPYDCGLNESKQCRLGLKKGQWR